MTTAGVARLVSKNTRIVEVDGPIRPRTSTLFYAGDPRYRPAAIGVSLAKKGSATRYLVNQGSAGDHLLASLAVSPKLAKPYTGAGWCVQD